MTYLWYAAFGSNLSTDRFATYLEGGRPPLGDQDHVESGARDPSAPTGSLPFATMHELYFAHRSRRWGGGGVAFLDARVGDATAGPTLCRIYRIALEQFEDVHRQENGARMHRSLDLDALMAHGQLVQYDRPYGLALLLGYGDDGLPVVTITARSRPTPPVMPDVRYLATIAGGLQESMGMTLDDVVDYLLTKEGVRGIYTTTSLTAALSEPGLLPNL